MIATTSQQITNGLKAQFAVRADRLQRGDTALGWKLGFGAPAAMEKLGIDKPLLGFLCGSALVPVGGSVALQTYTKAVAEPEIAVYMATDLGPNAGESATRAAIAGIGPAIELADLSFPPDNIERILAGNIFQRGLVLGPVDYDRSGANLDGLVAHLCKDGKEIAATTDMQANTGTIIDIVAGVADCLAGFDLALRAGDVVIVGSIVPPVIIEEPCVVSFRLDPFAAIAVEFTGDAAKHEIS